MLRRNCSLTPRCLCLCYGVLCAASLAVAGGFWAAGAWLVLPFACLELLAVGVAMLVYARHALDHERLHLLDGCLVVEHVHGNRVERVSMALPWIRVETGQGGDTLVRLRGGGQNISVGRYIRPGLRWQLAQELRMALGSGSIPPGAGAATAQA